MENQKKESSLQGRRIILLGASSGLGLATAKAAADEGARVVIVSGNQQRIDQALASLPPESEGYAVDLSKEENIQKFFEKAGDFDHLVFTAGENLKLNTINETKVTQAREFFNLRFWSAFAAIKYGAPHLRPGGSICLTSGTAGARPGSGWSVASAICGAMEGFVKAMAVELAPIRVNCVVPGVVETNLWSSLSEADRLAMYSQYADLLLVKRIGQAEDVAQGFIYLMKQQFGTGQSLVIDGGTLLV